MWWAGGNSGSEGGNSCPPGSKFSKTPKTFDKQLSTSIRRSSYLEKCVVTAYDFKPTNRGITPATKECEPGSRWSKSKQVCVKIMLAGLRKPGGNSRRSSRKCPPGRKWSERRKKCLPSSAKTGGGSQGKLNSKSLGGSIPPRPRPPPPRFSPGQVGK